MAPAVHIEFWARAVRDPELRDEFARDGAPRTRGDRISTARTGRRCEHRASRARQQLAVAVLALANGIAIEQLADPDGVDASTFGVILGPARQTHDPRHSAVARVRRAR